MVANDFFLEGRKIGYQQLYQLYADALMNSVFSLFLAACPTQ